MSDPVIKGVKRSPARPASRSSTRSAAKNRTLAGKSTGRPKPMPKRSAAEKAPARKATKSASASSSKSKSTKKAAKSAPSRKTAAAKPKPAATAKGKTATRKPAAPVKSAQAPKKSVKAPQQKTRAQQQTKTAKAQTERRPPAPAAQVTQPRPPSVDEVAALRLFERAHKEFVRGHFGEARSQFRALIDKFAAASEVAARARTYLAIAEARLRTESTLPRDADSLYDRGVIELNRGDFVAAQELFERALKREPDAAHIHYGLAATRSRLGSIAPALESLRRALEIHPNLRVRAQHDPDLAVLRNDPEFEQMVFAPRF